MQKSNTTIKVDTAENWEKAKKYVPDVFTIIVYEFADAAPKIKIGDGVHTFPKGTVGASETSTVEFQEYSYRI